jgi:hypothetical protein
MHRYSLRGVAVPGDVIRAPNPELASSSTIMASESVAFILKSSPEYPLQPSKSTATTQVPWKGLQLTTNQRCLGFFYPRTPPEHVFMQVHLPNCCYASLDVLDSFTNLVSLRHLPEETTTDIPTCSCCGTTAAQAS